jgi:hypothetical protein
MLPWSQVLIGPDYGHLPDTLAKPAEAIFTLLPVGTLIGTWNMSGTIATMMHGRATKGTTTSWPTT